MDMPTLLGLAREYGASDLHLSAGLPPRLRIDGELRALDLPALSHDAVLTLLQSSMSPAQQHTYATVLELDYVHALPDGARVRVNAYTQARGAGAACRIISRQVPQLADLQAPAILRDLAHSPRGLVLVAGPTGSGKSTTLAALLHEVNITRAGHILTIEDPIEFLHDSARCLVSQREVGTHSHSFAAALRAGLREDPDVILVGEMRDTETIRLALTAAETGHLVFASLHTASAVKTIDRIVDVFPAGEKDMARAMLAESLRAVVCQTLLKRSGGTGRVAAFEVMTATPAIRNLIRENRLAQAYSALQTGQAHGMQTLDQALAALVRAGAVAVSDARALAVNREAF